MDITEDKIKGCFIPGLEDVGTTAPVNSWAGMGDRVHATPEKVLDDLISNRLAGVWLQGRDASDHLNIPFKYVVEDATEHLEIYEKLLIFARWRKAQGF